MVSSEKIDYHSLHKDDVGDIENVNMGTIRSWVLGTSVFWGMIFFFTTFYGIIATSPMAPNCQVNMPQSHSDVVTCGNTPASAKAAGCIFDVNTWIWQPPACFDQELYDEETDNTQTEYFETYDGKVSVAYLDVLAGKYEELYTTNAYHVNHCTYAWKKLHRAVSLGRPLDSEIANLKHSMHCSMILRDPGDLKRVSTGARMSYASCVDMKAV